METSLTASKAEGTNINQEILIVVISNQGDSKANKRHAHIDNTKKYWLSSWLIRNAYIMNANELRVNSRGCNIKEDICMLIFVYTSQVYQLKVHGENIICM